MNSTDNLNSWLHIWSQQQISTDNRNKSNLISWSKQMISTADLNRWTQQIISTIDFNPWSTLNSWSKQMISTADLSRWTQQIGWQTGWLNNFSSLPTTASFPSNSLSHNVWFYRYTYMNMNYLSSQTIPIVLGLLKAFGALLHFGFRRPGATWRSK